MSFSLRYSQDARPGGTMIVGFPPGGGGFSFRDWPAEVGVEVTVAVVEPAGVSGSTADLGAMARAVADEVVAAGVDDVVLAGIGSGGLVAYEVCCLLRERDVAVSRLCVVAVPPAAVASTVDVPVLALAGKDDESMRGWAPRTRAGFRFEALGEPYAGVARKAVAGSRGLSRRAALRLGATATTVVGVLGASATGAAAAPVTVTTTDGTDPVELTAMMVRHDTSHLGEGGNTLPYAQMMQEIWRAAGAQTEIIPTPKAGNVHFIARIKGQGRAAPLMLMGHSDVVAVGNEQWSVDPYGGVVRDGFLYGRGTLDMKGTNAAFASALLRHIREGATFDRDIIYLADCDEEGGPHGMAWLVANHFDKVNAGAVLTEGGWLLTRQDGSPMVAAATCSDKRSALIEVTATARATHSTKPYPGQAILTLGKALSELDEFHTKVLPNELAREYFAAIAESTDNPRLSGAIRRLLHAQDQNARDRAGAQIVANSDYPDLHNALLRATVSFVSASSGYYSSIIPGQASATARVGFLPRTDDPVAVFAELRQFFAERDLTMRIVGGPGQSEEDALAQLLGNLAIPKSEVDTDIFRFWQDAVGQVYPGIPAVAGQFEASTSGNPLRAKGIPVYGIYPHTIDNETLNRMHGVDERIGVEPLRRGTEMLYRLFAHLKV
jgi:acetylornithine deacetylase/succinyl-diaminopimelate desuccinylase-like protein